MNGDCFPEEFFELSRLEELDLSYNQLQHLPPCLCMFIDLKKVNISGNNFEVACAIESHPADSFQLRDFFFFFSTGSRISGVPDYENLP